MAKTKGYSVLLEDKFTGRAVLGFDSYGEALEHAREAIKDELAEALSIFVEEGIEPIEGETREQDDDYDDLVSVQEGLFESDDPGENEIALETWNRLVVSGNWGETVVEIYD